MNFFMKTINKIDYICRTKNIFNSYDLVVVLKLKVWLWSFNTITPCISSKKSKLIWALWWRHWGNVHSCKALESS